jgi:hypothetical protein
MLLGFLAIISLSQGERGRIVIYKGMCDLLWTLWCVLYIYIIYTLSLTIRSSLHEMFPPVAFHSTTFYKLIARQSPKFRLKIALMRGNMHNYPLKNANYP